MKHGIVGKGIAGALLIGSSFGVASCSNGEQGKEDPTTTMKATTQRNTVNGCDSKMLEALRIIGASKLGGVNIVNDGECAPIYDPGTLQTIGFAASEGAILVECIDQKPTSFRVEVDGLNGSMNLSPVLIQRLEAEGNLDAFPACAAPTSVASSAL